MVTSVETFAGSLGFDPVHDWCKVDMSEAKYDRAGTLTYLLSYRMHLHLSLAVLHLALSLCLTIYQIQFELGQ